MTNKERNRIKKCILKSLTDENGIFHKDGDAIYMGTDLDMVLDCVWEGLKNYQKEVNDK